MISGQERLYWFCQLVAHGHSSSDAKRILDEAIEKLEKENKSEELFQMKERFYLA